MTLFLRFFIFSILFLSTLNDSPKDKTIFISPVKIPLLLSANFGELRIDHFHSGLDIKTQGVTGKEVVSAANGFIYRISVSPGGFGKALYVRHPSGMQPFTGTLTDSPLRLKIMSKHSSMRKRATPLHCFLQKKNSR